MSTKMDPKIKQQWVAALRSGKYKQGGGRLANADRTEHCCLGVLCELAVEAGVPVDIGSSTDGSMFFDGRGALLPYSVVEWAKVPADPQIDGVDLTTYNDGDPNGDTPIESIPFEQIADLIEEYL